MKNAALSSFQALVSEIPATVQALFSRVFYCSKVLRSIIFRLLGNASIQCFKSLSSPSHLLVSGSSLLLQKEGWVIPALIHTSCRSESSFNCLVVQTIHQRDFSKPYLPVRNWVSEATSTSITYQNLQRFSQSWTFMTFLSQIKIK